MDAFLVTRRLPLRRVVDKIWRGVDVATVAWRDIPHGMDRLVYLWASTMAHERGPVFTFTLDHIADLFGRPWRAPNTIERLQRLARSSLERTREHRGIQTTEQFATFDRFELDGVGGLIKLGALFTECELRELDLQAVRTLVAGKGSIAALDFYLWQVETAWSHRDHLPITIPLHGPGGVLDVLPGTIGNRYKACQALRLRLDKIRAAWPGCPNHLNAKRDGFVIEDVA